MEVTLSGEEIEGELPLVQGVYEIYRGPPFDLSPIPVILKGPGYENGRVIAQHRRVSGEKHLRISVLENTVKLEDLGSSFGSRLGGTKFDEYVLSGNGENPLVLGGTARFVLRVK